MDHTRDNPLKRFNAFWVAILLVTTFGIGCVILRPLTHGKVDTAYEAAAAERLAIKNDVIKAEASALNVDALNSQMESLAKTLNSSEPTQGVMPVAGALPAATDEVPVEEAPVEETPAETTPEPSN
jgi:hypothetical protein